MHGRFDRILTGTAIALVLGLGSLNPALAQTSQDQAAIEARVPLPEAANVPPPSAADVAAPETTGTTNTVNLPEPPALPPPPVKEAAPAATPAPAPVTAAPAVAPAPAPVVANADQPVMDALR